MTSYRRRLTFVVLGILAVLGLCACNAGSQIVVHPDGSGTFSTLITVEGTGGDALYQAVAKAEAANKVPLTVSRYSSGSESGARISAPFKSLNDLTALGNNLGSSTGLAGVQVTRAASGWTFVAHSDSGLVHPSGVSTGSTGGSIDGAQLVGLVHMSVSLVLPGGPGKTNADVVTHTADSTTFVWKLGVGRAASDLSAKTVFVGSQGSVQLATAITPLKAAGAGAVSASSPSSSGSGMSIGAKAGLGGGVVVLVLAGIVGVFIVRSRRSAA